MMFRQRAERLQEGGTDPGRSARWWHFRRRDLSGPAPLHFDGDGIAPIHSRADDSAENCQMEMMRAADGAEKDESPRSEPLRRKVHLRRLNTMEEIEAMRAGEGPSSSILSNEQFGSALIDDDNLSYSSERSLSTVEEDMDEACSVLHESEKLLFEEEDTTIGSKPKKMGFDVAAYMSEREMTPLQEKWNAITVVPNPMFCLYFLLAGKWLSREAIEIARAATESADGARDFRPPEAASAAGGLTLARLAGGAAFAGDENGCVRSPTFPNLHALPPLPIVAVAVGIILHAPFSFLYHWRYARRLPPGFSRIDHWSRRLDHSFIHVISACMSYGTSGSWDYFVANAMFNADCIYRQFKPRVRPRTNKIRILISVVAYTIPIFRRGDTALFCGLWSIFAVCGWLFAKYPIGGWSHSAFHAVIAFAPPLVMRAACRLLASKEQINIAARCAVLAGK